MFSSSQSLVASQNKMYGCKNIIWNIPCSGYQPIKYLILSSIALYGKKLMVNYTHRYNQCISALILKFQNHKPSHLGLLLVFCLLLRSGSIPRPLCCDQAPSCLVFRVRSNVSNVSNGSFGFLKTISDKHQYNSIYCFMCCQSANHWKLTKCKSYLLRPNLLGCLDVSLYSCITVSVYAEYKFDKQLQHIKMLEIFIFIPWISTALSHRGT